MSDFDQIVYQLFKAHDCTPSTDPGVGLYPDAFNTNIGLDTTNLSLLPDTSSTAHVPDAPFTGLFANSLGVAPFGVVSNVSLESEDLLPPVGSQQEAELMRILEV